MIFAEVDLQAEYWEVAMLVVAILQPLFVLVLIGGFVIASAHLLTMIGTRWGDRRVSSKALSFSVAVHVLLGCGVVAMIPEYRNVLLSRLAELEDEPIQILNRPDPQDVEVDHSRSGDTYIWNQIPQTLTPSEWERSQAPEVMASADAALQNPTEAPRFQPQRLADSQPLPPESRPVPTERQQAKDADLQQAAVDVQLGELKKQARPEDDFVSPVGDRSQQSEMGIDRESMQRPRLGSVDLIKPEVSADRSLPELTDSVSPEAPLSRAMTSEDIAKRSAPAPASPQPNLLGQEPSAEPTPSRNAGPAEPLVSRTKPRRSFSSDDTMGIGRFRPNVQPVVPSRTELSPSVSSGSDREPFPNSGEQPELMRQNDAFMANMDRNRVPSAYLLRTDENRERALLQYGGSEESEAAVDRALKWLASVQRPEGYWDASETGAGTIGIDEEGIDRQYAGREADAGITALAVLAFLGKGNTVDNGTYSPVVNRALRWLVKQQKVMHWPDGTETEGYLGGDASEYAGMYCHGMATFAMAEAYALSRESIEAQWLRGPLRNAIQFIVETQLSDGGWRYIKGQPDGDMSMFGWQLMALKSAEAAGIAIPSQVKLRMQRFLESRRQGAQGGLAGYRAVDRPTAPMTAEALFCRQMLGIANNAEATREAVELLLVNRPRRSTLNFYYWYYGTLAMHQHGGSAWQQWNSAMRDLVIAEQRRSGQLAGSWDPRGVWGGYGGRVYSTAVATLSLEVYYRYLPLYRLQQQ